MALRFTTLTGALGKLTRRLRPLGRPSLLLLSKLELKSTEPNVRLGEDPLLRNLLEPATLNRSQRRCWPVSLVPKAYEDLISRHQEMTDAIERGTITRNERREAIKAMIASIRNQEKAMFEAEVSMIKTMQDTIAMEQQLKLLDGAQNSILHRRRALGRMF